MTSPVIGHFLSVTSLRVSGTDDFIVLRVTEGDTNRSAAIPEFRAFQEYLQGRVTAPPVPERVAVVGSYRIF